MTNQPQPDDKARRVTTQELVQQMRDHAETARRMAATLDMGADLLGLPAVYVLTEEPYHENSVVHGVYRTLAEAMESGTGWTAEEDEDWRGRRRWSSDPDRHDAFRLITEVPF